MDYEKKYNEALNDMRVIYPNLKGDAKLAVEHAFPELRESEDERIRKGLVNFILYKAGHLLDEETEHKFIAYLEKQKEQKPIEWSEEDEMVRNAILGFLNPDKGGTKYSSNAELVEWSNWLKSLRPSWKPSEDEERLINTSISFLKDFADKGYENAVECIDWLKSKLNGNTGK